MRTVIFWESVKEHWDETYFGETKPEEIHGLSIAATVGENKPKPFGNEFLNSSFPNLRTKRVHTRNPITSFGLYCSHISLIS